MKKSKFTESQIRLNPGYFHVLMCFLLSARQIDQVHFNLSYQTLRRRVWQPNPWLFFNFRMKFYFDPYSEDTENNGIMDLHVIPNVCSEYSEQYLRDYLRGIYKKYLLYPTSIPQV
jgi:hypothetical protein